MDGVTVGFGLSCRFNCFWCFKKHFELNLNIQRTKGVLVGVRSTLFFSILIWIGSVRRQIEREMIHREYAFRLVDTLFKSETIKMLRQTAQSRIEHWMNIFKLYGSVLNLWYVQVFSCSFVLLFFLFIRYSIVNAFKLTTNYSSWREWKKETQWHTI